MVGDGDEESEISMFLGLGTRSFPLPIHTLTRVIHKSTRLSVDGPHVTTCLLSRQFVDSTSRMIILDESREIDFVNHSHTHVHHTCTYIYMCVYTPHVTTSFEF